MANWLEATFLYANHRLIQSIWFLFLYFSLEPVLFLYTLLCSVQYAIDQDLISYLCYVSMALHFQASNSLICSIIQLRFEGWFNSLETMKYCFLAMLAAIANAQASSCLETALAFYEITLVLVWTAEGCMWSLGGLVGFVVRYMEVMGLSWGFVAIRYWKGLILYWVLQLFPAILLGLYYSLLTPTLLYLTTKIVLIAIYEILQLSVQQTQELFHSSLSCSYMDYNRYQSSLGTSYPDSQSVKYRVTEEVQAYPRWVQRTSLNLSLIYLRILKEDLYISNLQEYLLDLKDIRVIGGLTKGNVYYLQKCLLSHPNFPLFYLLYRCNCSFIGSEGSRKPFLSELRRLEVDSTTAVMRKFLEKMEGRLIVLWMIGRRGRIERLTKWIWLEVVTYL